MPTYTRITLKKRYLIAQQLQQGSAISYVARVLRRSKSSLSTEVRHCGMRPARYCPKRANIAAERLQQKKPLNHKIHELLEEVIELLMISRRLSPKQISGYVKHYEKLVK